MIACLPGYLPPLHLLHLLSENILMGNREDMRSLKLSDFGLSVKNQEGTRFASYSQKCGTVMFMAPEMIILEKQYSKVSEHSTLRA